MNMQRHGSDLGNIARKAKANRRYERVIALSKDGVSKADAAESVGLTVDGLANLLYRRTGSKRWPIAE